MKEAAGKTWRESVCMQVTAQVNREEVSGKKREGEGKRNREREIQKRDPSSLPTTLPGPDQSESDLT